MEIGERIDGFVVTEVLPGGMSEVYRVSDGKNRYVLKRVREDASEEGIKLFRREIRILKSLHHPNIIEIISDNENSPQPYYVMPNCGKSFVDLAISQISDLELLDLAINFCEAIHFAHQSGVFHRDIKPQNVLLCKGIVKVVDFGLSRFVNRDTTTITKTSTKAGTLGYMPPEYSTGAFKDGTIEGDVYMIGKTLYYVFSHGKDVSNVRAEMVSTRMFAIVDKCTRDEPSQRYASVGSIISELNEYRNLLLEAEEAPKTIKEIKATYQPNTQQFNAEVFKTLCSLGDNPMNWGETLGQLTNRELSQAIVYNKDSIVLISLNFIDSLANPSDYIQFAHIDEYARFVKILVEYNDDEAIKQNLLSFMINMTIDYTRYPAMKIMASVLNDQMERDASKYRIYVMLNRKSLKEICDQLGTDSVFNESIRALLKS